MPRQFSYVCQQCDTEFEYLHVRTDDVAECPSCATKDVVKKEVPSRTSFQLKGHGWASDGYGLGRKGKKP
jgi:putative FmdB family regulatory protein